jgi:hypothetical protein
LIGEILVLRKTIEKRGIFVDDRNMIFLLPRTYNAKELRKRISTIKVHNGKEFRMAGGN